MKNILLASNLCAMTLLSGCGKSTGDEFVGKWVNDRQTIHMEITRNGDSFIIVDEETQIMSKQPVTSKIPATYQDGVLRIDMGLGSGNIGYDKRKDTIFMPSAGNGSIEMHRDR
ncbi:hypothetical protein [Paraburkholderia lycopersici]|uniref:Membrane-bound lysozyme-inhibitor of c-type lysozyme n=1 Tax=Paraburkholderia lycopersici TaxID=416944 RepID=A0A1G7DHW7_9BURK|nr:hypothetical protein [Paraburkholderia lycopersici]SDE51154.1 hypothetical protein SAMN05421548_1626 [Paraburkholderia lycopersici]